MVKAAWLGIIAQAILVILRLAGHIQWDWLWVISPLWIFGVVCVVLFAIWQITILIFSGIDT